jgi:hypothetical protein
MNSFSERSYKAILEKGLKPKSAAQGSNSETKREGGAAVQTQPTVQRVPPNASPAQPTPSSSFTKPAKTTSSSRERRARALAMSSPPRRMDLDNDDTVLQAAIAERQQQAAQEQPHGQAAESGGIRAKLGPSPIKTAKLASKTSTPVKTNPIVIHSDGDEDRPVEVDTPAPEKRQRSQKSIERESKIKIKNKGKKKHKQGQGGGRDGKESEGDNIDDPERGGDGQDGMEGKGVNQYDVEDEDEDEEQHDVEDEDEDEDEEQQDVEHEDEDGEQHDVEDEDEDGEQHDVGDEDEDGEQQDVEDEDEDEEQQDVEDEDEDEEQQDVEDEDEDEEQHDVEDEDGDEEQQDVEDEDEDEEQREDEDEDEDEDEEQRDVEDEDDSQRDDEGKDGRHQDEGNKGEGLDFESSKSRSGYSSDQSSRSSERKGKRRVSFSDNERSGSEGGSKSDGEGSFEDAEDEEDHLQQHKQPKQSVNSGIKNAQQRAGGKQRQRNATRASLSEGEEECEEDGVFVWAPSQILSREELAKRKREQERELKEQEQENKAREPAEQSIFTPSHRAHLVQRVREATGVDESEAALALGAALRQKGSRTPTAVIERTCGIVMERMRERVRANLAEAVEQKRRSIKRVQPKQKGSSSEGESDEEVKLSKRGRPDKELKANKASRDQEAIQRRQRRVLELTRAALDRKAKRAATAEDHSQDAVQGLSRLQQASVTKRGGVEATRSQRPPPPPEGGKQQLQASRTRGGTRGAEEEEGRNLVPKAKNAEIQAKMGGNRMEEGIDKILSDFTAKTPKSKGGAAAPALKKGTDHPKLPLLPSQEELDAGLFRVMQEVQNITRGSLQSALKAARIAYEEGGTLDAARAINVYYEQGLEEGSSEDKRSQSGARSTQAHKMGGSSASGGQAASSSSRDQQVLSGRETSMGVLPMTTVPEWSLGEPPEGGPHHATFKQKLAQFERYKNQTANRTTVTFKSCIDVDLRPSLEGKCDMPEYVWNEVCTREEENAALKEAKGRGETVFTKYRSGWTDARVIEKLKETLKPPRVEDYEIQFEKKKLKYTGAQSGLWKQFETWAADWLALEREAENQGVQIERGRMKKLFEAAIRFHPSIERIIKGKSFKSCKEWYGTITKELQVQASYAAQMERDAIRDFSGGRGGGRGQAHQPPQSPTGTRGGRGTPGNFSRGGYRGAGAQSPSSPVHQSTAGRGDRGQDARSNHMSSQYPWFWFRFWFRV